MLTSRMLVRCGAENALKNVTIIAPSQSVKVKQGCVGHLHLAPARPTLCSATVRNYAATKQEVDEHVRKYKEGNFDKIPDPERLEHFKTHEALKTASSATVATAAGKAKVTGSTTDVTNDSPPPVGTHALPHPIWSKDELDNVVVTHKPPSGVVDKMAFYSVKLMRKSFDLLTLFDFGERTERKWVLRICFLETVAGVPGMVAAMTRHLTSLRRLERDHGWIHTLLEEAENERMHLMTALQLRQPTRLFRGCVIGAQGIFVTFFSFAYMLSPRFCHRFVGYLEEEAVITYTKCIKDIKDGPMKHWQTQEAPDLAIRYWKLDENATMLDVILAIRADEAHHRVVNHTLASLKEDDYNPYKPGK
ncbi:alternative oxidase, mitochondrial-like [Mizuhopecten yessoensis]|uniref:Alternative oxidase, mitochondrial n=1 Tax=Mizuhopecten yessoensis TaxID=6573 RepID=A0A210Q1M5_MIZYE|nr:alternative oxidase, mitochondrial-like [Mizuhopecten yessoensis]OWF42636.1 Alternative oxidase, mitochondrial [Mizuhopecten yessoensis]